MRARARVPVGGDRGLAEYQTRDSAFATVGLVAQQAGLAKRTLAKVQMEDGAPVIATSLPSLADLATIVPKGCAIPVTGLFQAVERVARQLCSHPVAPLLAPPGPRKAWK